MSKANARLTFNDNACKGCDLCVDACPVNILELDLTRLNSKGYNVVKCLDMGKCMACAMCAKICPDSVIKVERDA